jgi:hypothetical protein
MPIDQWRVSEHLCEREIMNHGGRHPEDVCVLRPGPSDQLAPDLVSEK